MPDKFEKLVRGSLRRLGRPLTFVVVTLAATAALLFLYAVRADFVEKLNYPLLVVGSDYGGAARKSYPLRAGELTAGIAGRDVCAGSDSAHDEALITTEAIVCRSVDDVKYRNFKNETELIAALQDSAAAQRAAQLKHVEAGLELIENNRYDFEFAKNKSLEELKEKIAGLETAAEPAGDASSETAPASETLSRAGLEKLLGLYPPPSAGNAAAAEKPKGPDFAKECGETIRGALAGGLKKLTGDSLAKSELDERVAAAFKEREKARRADAARLRTQLDQTGGLYDRATEKFYSLKNVPLKPAPNPLAFLFLADDGGLFVVYKLVMLTLTAIVVFALLFLILIPLRNIFFLDPAADAMIDKAKGVIDLRSPRIDLGGPVGALLATVATVGIGVAAIAATPSPGGPENIRNDSHDIAQISKNYGGLRRSKNDPNGRKNDAETDPAQADIDVLAANVLALDQSVGDLDRRISNWQPVIVPTDGEGIDVGPIIQAIGALKSQIDVLNRRLNNGQPGGGTELATLVAEVNEIKTNVGKLDTKVGNPPANAPANAPRTLFENFGALNPKVESLSQILGTPKDPGNSSTVFGSLGNLSDAVGVKDYRPDQATLFQNVTDAAKKTTTIEKNTSEVGRYILGGPGKNIFGQLNTLFSGQRYVVTSFAVDELNKLNPKPGTELDAIIKALEASKDTLRLRSFSADDLFRELNGRNPAITKEVWKKWKDIVLRSTRITRS